jgi:glycosyltransferase involved in cell wall biosynthesis
VNAIAGLGFAFTHQSFVARSLKYALTRILKLVFISRSSIAISQNRHDSEWLVKQGIVERDRSITILSSGVDTDIFRPSALRTDRDRIAVLFAARLLRNKGLLEFLEAGRQLDANGIEAELYVAGDVDPGNPQSFSADELPKLFSRTSVKYLGHVDSMPELLSRMDIFVLPTTYGEGVPKSLIEAAASGLALVATDIPGCLEVIEDSINGIVINTTDVCQVSTQIALAVIRMYEDRVLLERLQVNARSTATEKFQCEEVYRQTEAVYLYIT